MTNEQLQEIEAFAYKTLTWKEIAIIIGVPEDEFRAKIDNVNSDAFKAYKRGQLRLIADLRKSEIDLALRGHSDAQKRVQKNIDSQRKEEV